jgi:hypothetical protein
MKTQDLREEKNDSQPDATPLAAAADSHQPMIENENPPLTDMPLAAAGSQQPILMSIPELQEEKNGTQPAATPLASDADSRQPGSVSNHGIEEEKKQVPATNRNLQEAGSHQLGSAINPDIDEEMNDPQVPAMHLAAAAGSHQLISGLDFDPNEIELELPSEGSVLVVDSSCVPADAQDLSQFDFKKLVNNDAIQRRFRTSNPGEGASLVEIDEPVEVPSFSGRTLFFTGKASFT